MFVTISIQLLLFLLSIALKIRFICQKKPKMSHFHNGNEHLGQLTLYSFKKKSNSDLILFAFTKWQIKSEISNNLHIAKRDTHSE